MYNGSPKLVDSNDDFGEHLSNFSDEMKPNLVNETTTDLKLNLLANQMKVIVHNDSEIPEVPENVQENVNKPRKLSNQSIAVSTENDDIDNDEMPHNRQTEVPHQYPFKQGVPQQVLPNPTQQRFRKIELLRIFHELEERGIPVSTKYTINSSLEEMEQEYEILRSIQTKKNGVKLYKGFLVNTIQAIEFMNESYNPFDFHLKGWSEHVNSGIDDYEDVLADLYEKYKKSGKKMEPELKLMLMLVTSATTFHASNTFLKNVPGLSDVVKNNPKIINNIAKNIIKDPKPKTEQVPQEFKQQTQMKGPNPKEFLRKMREEQMNSQGFASYNEFIPPQSTKPPVPVSPRDEIPILETETVSEILSSTKKKKKQKGITIDI